MNQPSVHPSTFASRGRSITGRAGALDSVPQERRFRALFAVSPDLCSIIWTRLGSYKPDNCDPIHLLWCLLFLKVCGTEHFFATIASVERKTYRKWPWAMVVAISNLNLVRKHSMVVTFLTQEFLV